jgi:hypothetical protein
MGTGVLPGDKAMGCESDQSSLSNAEVKNTWIYTFTPPHIPMAWCLISHKNILPLPFPFTYISYYCVFSEWPYLILECYLFVSYDL